MEKLRLGVLASGQGSNLQAIINATADGRIDGIVTVVISDHQEAFALERARQNNIPAHYLDINSFAGKAAFEEEIVNILRNYQVDLVCLAGYMRVLSSVVLDAFPQRIINIHPALLPAFPGLHGQKQAWDYGVKFSGCTVHFVDQGIDTGPIIIQAVVPVLDEDTADTLAARILEQEHQIFPEAIQRFAQGKLAITGRKVFTKR
ncbi:MAG: phosphoribosylglycinamide formyltransferase [Peptococcaceae bacterium]|nr:phosphoribosylglycinamide formyltransferase [Peptococcaceae bacterium]